jgi:uncharacterized membrane protein
VDSNLLRVGVSFAATIVIIGGLIYLIDNGTSVPKEHIFHGEPADLRQIPGIFHDVLALQGRGIIQLGILLLILTPIARVTFSVFGFWKQKDWLYTIITLIVFAILLHSLIAI